MRSHKVVLIQASHEAVVLEKEELVEKLRQLDEQLVELQSKAGTVDRLQVTSAASWNLRATVNVGKVPPTPLAIKISHLY